MSSYFSRELELALLAIFLITLFAAGPIPPPDEKMHGIKKPPKLFFIWSA